MYSWNRKFKTTIHLIEEVAQIAQERLGISCEVIDLVSILPWDRETIFNSVKNTGRCIIAHEAPYTNGFGAELSAAIQVIYTRKSNAIARTPDPKRKRGRILKWMVAGGQMRPRERFSSLEGKLVSSPIWAN